MTRIFEIAGLSTYSLSAIASAVAPAAPVDNLIFQLGALGLCAFMVFQNYRQSSRQFTNYECLVTRLSELETQRSNDAKKLADALDRLGEALEDRPCICGDQRIKH